MKNLLSLFFFALSICFFNVNSQTQETRTMNFDGNSREYIIYIPSNYDGSVEFPLMFNFHGGGGLSSDFMNYYNDMRPLADTAGFIAVYPQAAIDPVDGSYAWLHKAPTSHNDIFLIEAIIDTLSSEFSIDNDRVYACGYSEGGIFSYELACRLNNRIAAISSVSGSMLEDSFRNSYYDLDFCSPVHPTAVLLIPGTADSNPHSSYNGFPPYYMSVEEITTYWSNYNNTDINPIINQLPNTNLFDGSYVEQRIWENGDNCSRIEELKVIGGDHDWPGAFGNMDINSSLEAWLFFELSINNSLSNNDMLANNLIISPNPVKERIIIRSDLDDYSYTLYDLNGKKLLEDNKPEINFSNKAKGTYFLKIYSNDKTTTKKIIKL